MQEGKKMTFNDDTYSSVAANNSHHITKQKLLKIREIYEFCKNAQQNLQVRHIVNAKFAQIVEEAEEQIKLFAEGKLNIDNDALDLMKEYIEEFGRNYYKHGGQMRYEYSPEATKAKIMLEQHRYQTTRRQGAVSAEMSETFNLDAMSRGTADEFVLPDNELFESDTAETAAAPMSEEYSMNIRETKSGVKEVSDNTALRIQRETENPAETVSVPMTGETVAEQPVVDETEKITSEEIHLQANKPADDFVKPVQSQAPVPSQPETEHKPDNGTAVASQPQAKIDSSVRAAKKQSAPKTGTKKKSGMSFFRQVKEFCGDAAKAFRRNIKRYGVAAATLFSTTGAYNGYPMNDNASYKAALNSKQISLPDITPDQSAGLTASFTQAAEENKSYPDYEPTDFGFTNPLLEQTLINTMAQQVSPAAEENVVTLADLPYTDIEFSAEDLAAMVPGETALKLAENAEDVAARMNCEGYCFRGAKKAFRETGLGEMYGRSAYMAKRQLDANPHFVRIKSHVSNNTVVPDGGVGVYGRSASHPHGHIGIFSGNKDCSSKIRRPMTSTGSYSSFDLYLPADTRVPASVLKKINQIQVLEKHYGAKPQPKLISPFLLAIQNLNSNS